MYIDKWFITEAHNATKRLDWMVTTKTKRATALASQSISTANLTQWI